ncbi:dUTP diphosphatase [Lysinibacillus xylanilyticus]|uniref:dUTP diphosphatase n=1 Tax=Lysinibacillus xylanilyticus TaxID=582475 RepID=UPI002B243DCB|nr:dUTP diphosphatase [Lysinibacillus xylanilyticus]MEB2279689.1 dUTP diphosphatase [Lysinibacillus xylanilyticus]
MDTVELFKQRLSLLAEINRLSDLNCTEDLAYRAIGIKLEENIVAIRALRVSPESPKPKVQPVKTKIQESKGEKMTKQLTVETYHEMKAQGLTDSAIRKQLGIDNNKFYKFKQDNGLIRAYDKAVKKEKTTPTLREKEVNSSKIDTDRISILEKELSDFKAQLKDALSFIESLKTENATLNEQVWGSRLQVLYAKQAELENFIADKHGISIHDYLNEQQLAILVELAESANEWQGFKYWKLKKDVDREKLLEETVDVLHLILARGIVLGWQVATVKAYKTTSITMQYTSLMQKVVAYEESQKTYAAAFNLYAGLVEMLGFTWLEVEEAYMKKHQKNIERQKNDY